MSSNGTRPVFVTRVRLRNYRSIAGCDVHLEPFTILVGPNGSGKSNFFDALRLTAEGLRGSLDHALRERSGVAEVRRKSHGHPNDFAVRLDFQLDGSPGYFVFVVAARSGGAYQIQHEECAWAGARYVVEDGELTRPPGQVSPPVIPDRLYLVNAAGLPAFRPVFDALSTMGFYNISPAKIRALQAPDQGDLLDREGTNLASVLDRLGKAAPDVKERIEEYLSRVVPGLEGFDATSVGHMETIEFRQRVVGSKQPWRFPAINMSDGTLRALAVLTALFQFGERPTARLIGIEEPETALHPAAAGLLLLGGEPSAGGRHGRLWWLLIPSDVLCNHQILHGDARSVVRSVYTMGQHASLRSSRCGAVRPVAHRLCMQPLVAVGARCIAAGAGAGEVLGNTAGAG